MSEQNAVKVRLDNMWKEIAVCHCGSGYADRASCENHNFAWNECPESRLIADASSEIARLERALVDAKNAHVQACDVADRATRRAEEAEGAVKASNQLLLDIGEAIRELPASDGRVIGMVHFLAHIDKCVAGPKKGEVANG